MLIFDIATKAIEPSTAIWVIFPGTNRRLLSSFLQFNAVFLETPGLNINKAAIQSTAAIRQHVRMSQTLRRYHESSVAKTAPSRRASTYSDQPFDGKGRVLAGNVRKLFAKMKIGDLVIVPGRSAFGDVSFGEIISDFDPKDTLTVKSFADEIQYRRVRWVTTNVPRQSIPIHLQGYLSKPPAIAAVPRSEFTDEFFSFAYPSFVLADKSAVVLRGPGYDGKNPLDITEANIIVSYFISAFNAIDKNKLAEFSQLEINAAIEKFYNRDLVISYTQNFNSPGKFGLLAASAVLAGFVSMGVAISISQKSPDIFQGEIKVTNSVSPLESDVPSEAGIKLGHLLKSLGKDKIEKVQKYGAESKNKIGLNTPVKIEEKK